MKREARVLFLTKYGRSGASSRYRVLQYIPYLESRGFRCEVQSLHGDAYLEAFYGGRRPSLFYSAARLAARAVAVARASRYSAVFIQKELAPYVPPVLELSLALRRVKVVYDIDDAIFLAYAESRNPLVRLLLGRKIPAALRWSSVVLAGNEFLLDYARRYNGCALLVPTVVDESRYPASRETGRADRSKRPVIGWIGSPDSVRYVETIAGCLRRVSTKIPFTLRVIGAPGFGLDGLDVDGVAWSEEREALELAKCDIGIMPLPSTGWSRGKCGLKLLQYMASGLPVVSSPEGSGETIVRHGVSGFIARSDEEWHSYLLMLLDNPDLGARMGSAGRARVEEHFSLRAWAPRMADIIERCARGERPREKPA